MSAEKYPTPLCFNRLVNSSIYTQNSMGCNISSCFNPLEVLKRMTIIAIPVDSELACIYARKRQVSGHISYFLSSLNSFIYCTRSNARDASNNTRYIHSSWVITYTIVYNFLCTNVQWVVECLALKLHCKSEVSAYLCFSGNTFSIS